MNANNENVYVTFSPMRKSPFNSSGMRQEKFVEVFFNGERAGHIEGTKPRALASWYWKINCKLSNAISELVPDKRFGYDFFHKETVGEIKKAIRAAVK